jgi:hypothetical protein
VLLRNNDKKKSEYIQYKHTFLKGFLIYSLWTLQIQNPVLRKANFMNKYLCEKKQRRKSVWEMYIENHLMYIKYDWTAEIDGESHSNNCQLLSKTIHFREL